MRIFSDGFPNLPGLEPTEPFFDRFDRSDATIVRQVMPRGKNQTALSIGDYWLSPSLILRQRGKHEELFVSAFGTVFTTLEYFYDTSVSVTRSVDFRVRAYRNYGGRDQPKIIKELPRDASTLNAITVIRIFPDNSDALIIVATYGPEGNLRDVTADRSHNGDWEGQLSSNDIRKDMQMFGVPGRFRVQEYQAAPRALKPVIDRPSVLTVINFHYNLNRWVRQDLYSQSDAFSAPETRYIEYRFTPQDAALDALDRTLPFNSIDRCRMDKCLEAGLP